MKANDFRLSVSTKKPVDVENITHLIERALSETKIGTGVCLVSVPHTTCGLMVNEHETGLVQDIERLAAEVLEPLARAGGFRHDRVDHNAQAHLTASLLGTSLSLPIRRGALHLGTWQSVFLVECDGPRNRTLDLTFMGL